MKQKADETKRNVVLVTIDSLRADHCSYWGYDRKTTPTLDGMAEDGIVFENAVAPGPKTPESMPAVFTGEFPVADLEASELGSWREQIHPHMSTRETVAERFSRHGYTTAAFTPNGFTSEFFGFDAGFDHFEDFLDEDFRPGFEVPNVLRGLFKWVRREGNWKQWEKYYDRVVRFLRTTTEPYFLWVFLLDVHSPYLVPRQYRTENSWPEMIYANWKRSIEEESLKRRLVSAYDDSIRYADSFLEQLLRDVDGTDTVVAVHSDHGEAFGEHGFHGHEKLLFEENTHVPLVLGNVGTSASVDTPFSLRRLPDLLGTVSYGDSTDLTTELRRIDADRYPIVSRSRESNRVAVRSERFKLITDGNESILYDIENDPNERNDASDSHPDARNFLRTVAERHRSNNAEKRTINGMVSTLSAESVSTSGL